MAQAKADEYEGVMLGYMNVNGVINDGLILAITPEVAIPDDCQVFHAFSGTSFYNLSYGVFRDENGEKVFYASLSDTTPYRSTNNPQYWDNAEIRARIKTCQFVFDVRRIDDIYMLDVTHNVYLFKGKNV